MAAILFSLSFSGYVLDGFPSLCEDWLSMADQLDLVKNLPLVPDFIVNLKVKENLNDLGVMSPAKLTVQAAQRLFCCIHVFLIRYQIKIWRSGAANSV